MDKILRINMGADGGPKAKTEPIGSYAGLGGRALTSAIVSKEVPPSCHPLSAENKLVIAPGLLSGSAAAMSGRISVGCKSPLTGGIKEANSGGQPSQMLARLGYAAIVLEGKPADDTLYRVLVTKDKVEIKADGSLKMLGNYAVVDKMKSAFGEKVACISIGPAGEMKMSAASIAFTDMEQRPTRHAGRGGVGAVMGAKGVKVIVVDDAGCAVRAPKTPDKFKEANKTFVAGLRKHGVTGQGLPTYGTNVLTNVINEAGAYPTKQLHVGSFRRLLQDQRRDPGADRERARRRGLGHPRLPPGLRHPLLRHLLRQGRQLPHQAARVRDGVGPRRQLRHRRPRCDRHDGPAGRRLSVWTRSRWAPRSASRWMPASSSSATRRAPSSCCTRSARAPRSAGSSATARR